MTHPAIVVFEQRPRWVPELRRQLADLQIRIQSTGTVRATVETCRPSATNRRFILVVHSEVAPHQILQVLGEVDLNVLDGLIVTANDSLKVLEPSLRELGATSFYLEPVDPQRIAGEIRRLLRAGLTSNQA